jgi:hypothetical protein
MWSRPQDVGLVFRSTGQGIRTLYFVDTFLLVVRDSGARTFVLCWHSIDNEQGFVIGPEIRRDELGVAGTIVDELRLWAYAETGDEGETVSIVALVAFDGRVEVRSSRSRQATTRKRVG